MFPAERALAIAVASLWISCTVFLGCREDMFDQPKVEPLEATEVFADETSARPAIPNTVARGHLDLDDHLHRGRVGGELAETFPFAIDVTTLERGRVEYGVYCAPCHGESGYGNGTIVRRGFPEPPSFHSDRMRAQPVGHYFVAITEGFGKMYDYRARISARDRWAVVAYIRALQLSQRATLDDLPEDVRVRLEAE